MANPESSPLEYLLKEVKIFFFVQHGEKDEPEREDNRLSEVLV